MTVGVLIVDKPRGMTSFDVVARVRRLAGEKRVGHAGTLDPLATGVLPICLGAATRLVELLEDATKEYQATVCLGATSPTYDAEGPITAVPGARLPDEAALAAALAAFRGAQQQLPPMYSAVQQDGRRLYDLARQGIEVERRPRAVTIHELDLLAYTPPTADLRVVCSKGTYIRSLAHDLGAALDCGAYLAGLVRTRHGPFRLADAVDLPALQAAAQDGTLAAHIQPLGVLLGDWPRVDLDADAARHILQGRPLVHPPPGAAHAPPRLGAYGPDGRFLALVTWDESKGHWQPVKVFPGT